MSFLIVFQSYQDDGMVEHVYGLPLTKLRFELEKISPPVGFEGGIARSARH